MSDGKETLNRVRVLLPGFSGGTDASGTVTLVQAADRNILVDTGDPWNKDALAAAINHAGLDPRQITDVVITHGHLDHCGNLAMFPEAKFWMDKDVAVRGQYEVRDEKAELSPGVELTAFRGHSHRDLVLTVRQTLQGTVVIAGDLFENKDDEDVWRELSEYQEEQEKARQHIRSIGDYIVPGHGDIFKVVHSEGEEDEDQNM